MSTTRECAQQFFRRVLRFLHVRLIERIDSETPARYRSRKLPCKKFRAELVQIGEFTIDNRMAVAGKCIEPCFGLFRNSAKRDRNEQTIAAIYIRTAQRLSVYRKYACAFFTSALRDQLFDPQS